MAKLSPISARKLVKILLALDFVEIRRKGSHRFFFNHQSGFSTVVPDHGSEDIGVGLLRKILHEINLGLEEFNELK